MFDIKIPRADTGDVMSAGGPFCVSPLAVNEGEVDDDGLAVAEADSEVLLPFNERALFLSALETLVTKPALRVFAARMSSHTLARRLTALSPCE